jgi:DNA-binding HxlR family transcriptional regulator
MIPRASKKMLAQNLRELEASGIITRKDLSDVVLHIEYELSGTAKDDICSLLEHLAHWGEASLKREHKGLEVEERGEGAGGGT